ncbi:MAG: hypothetical protein EP330_27470 [Deltaproteobacteria bacterium]|nr:MAG: hypothetical protein EP330_27470 [Deltaproteobacteria bacterium]
MASESIILRTRDKREVEGTAEVHRTNPASRTAYMVGFPVAGLILGIPTIFIPGVHFVAPWALPLAGLVVGGYMAGRTGVVSDVKGTCPECGEAFTAEGGSLGNDTLYVRCTGCKTPLEVVIPE